jgi:eukaryotic-like serine/threonine-protein kinase
MGLTSSLYCAICGASNEAHADSCFACNHPLSTQQASVPVHLFPHTLFRDRYYIIGKIGAGGFGSVYKAADTQSGNCLVAIKEVSLLGLHPQAVIEATEAFQHEVSLLSQLDHPNLPRLYEHFHSPGYWYLVMDFIAGETLEEYQSKAPNGHLPLSEVLSIGIQLCTVLNYLHAQQPPIVFRDLKPANIMRTAEGQLYLIDFGIARYFKPGQAKDTVALGSLGYAAPEQYGKAQTTPRADIYSLGAVLHQLLTTKDPSEAPFRFTRLRPNSPQSRSDPGSLTTSIVEILVNKLEILITSMLDMDVNRRPSNVARVKQELECISQLWSDVYKSFWRPRLGYTPQART